MTHTQILPQPGRDNKRPPSSTTHERNTGADAPLDAAPNSPAASEEDAVRAGLLLPEAPVRLDGSLLCIGPRVLEFHTEEAADSAAVAVHKARLLAGIPEPGECAEALPEGQKGGLAPAWQPPMNYGRPNLSAEDLAAVVRQIRPDRVVIDLAGNRVDLQTDGGAPCVFLFPNPSDAWFAGLAAEMARRESQYVAVTARGLRALGRRGGRRR